MERNVYVADGAHPRIAAGAVRSVRGWRLFDSGPGAQPSQMLGSQRCAASRTTLFPGVVERTGRS